MRQIVFSQFAHLVLCATLAPCVFACSDDSDHSPPIGAPSGPAGPVIAEGGSFSGAGRTGQAGASATAGAPSYGGIAGSFGTPGIGGANQFGGGSGGIGNASNDPFGIAGSGSDPFGSAGALIPRAGSSSF